MKLIKKAVFLLALTPVFITPSNALNIVKDTITDTITEIRHEIAALCNFAAHYAFANWALKQYMYYGSLKNIYQKASWNSEKTLLLQYLTFIAALKTTAFLIKPQFKVYTYQIQHP